MLGEKAPERFRRNDRLFYVAGAVAFLLVVGLCVGTGALPLPVLLVYLAASTLSFLMYAWDKGSAQRGAWRTKESTLHLISLLGGWPGAMIAQQTLRHKSSKEEFRFFFWITVAVNAAVFVWLFTDSGSAFLDALLT